MHRVVIDTNVLISGIIQKSGFPFKVVKLWEDEVIVLITSIATIEEAERVLNYPKIRKRYALTNDDISRTVSNLLKYSVLVEDPPIPNVIEQDPDDNKILATALAGKADYIISGDMHLLTLKNYRGIEIVTPKRFCEITGE
ncbi:MAG: putative toxin-antitoxin system toxin component, PIN family [Patescibacteria group bacterium]